MKIISMKCPECHANISVDDGRIFCFCEYCGTKIIVQNENEHIYRYVDEAEVKQAETDRIIKMKELDLREKKRIEDEKRKSFKIKLSIIFGVVGALLLILGYLAGDATGDPDSGLYMIAFVGMISLMAAVGVFKSCEKEEDDLEEKIKENNVKAKNKWITLVLCLFLGFLGIHKFYEGKILFGIVYLFTCGLLGVGIMVDLFIIAFKPNPYYP